MVFAGACTPGTAEKESTASSVEQQSEVVGGLITDRSRLLDDRCGFDPVESWMLIETFGGFDRYSIDPENPVTASPERGEAGVFVSVACQSTDGLGGLGFISLPGVTLIEDGDVALGGGTGNRRIIHFDDPAFPPALANIAYVIRVDGTQCSVRADGSVEAIQAAAAEIQAVADSLLCVGA